VSLSIPAHSESGTWTISTVYWATKADGFDATQSLSYKRLVSSYIRRH